MLFFRCSFITPVFRRVLDSFCYRAFFGVPPMEGIVVTVAELLAELTDAERCYVQTAVDLWLPTCNLSVFGVEVLSPELVLELFEPRSRLFIFDSDCAALSRGRRPVLEKQDGDTLMLHVFRRAVKSAPKIAVRLEVCDDAFVGVLIRFPVDHNFKDMVDEAERILAVRAEVERPDDATLQAMANI